MRSAAAHAVAESERAHERGRLNEEPDWAAFVDVAYLHGASVTSRSCRESWSGTGAVTA